MLTTSYSVPPSVYSLGRLASDAKPAYSMVTCGMPISCDDDADKIDTWRQPRDVTAQAQGWQTYSHTYDGQIK